MLLIAGECDSMSCLCLSVCLKDLSCSALTSSSIFTSAAVPLQPLHSHRLSQTTALNVLQPANTSFPPVAANTIVPAMYPMFRSPAVTAMQPAYPPSTLSLGASRPLYNSPMPVLPVQQPLLPQSTVASPVRTAASAPHSAMGEQLLQYLTTVESLFSSYYYNA